MSESEPTSSNGAKQPHIVVIGGGLAGLSAAHRLLELRRAAPRESSTSRLRLTLLEGSGRLGGAIATRSLGDYRVVESGADMFITDKPWAVALCERLGIGDQLISTNARFRRSLVLCKGKPTPVPRGFMLMAPSQLRPILETPLLSPLGKLRMAADLVLPRRRARQDETIGHFVRRRMGAQALRRIVQPLVGGIYTGDPDQLSLQATLPRFIAMEQNDRSLILASMRKAAAAGDAAGATSGARYGMFASFPRGMRTLIDALEERLRLSANVRLASTVEQLEPHAEGYRLRSRDGREWHADGVVLALPAYRSAALLEPISPAIARRLNAIPYASTALVLSGHPLKNVSHPLTAFGLVVPAAEKRNILAVSFASRKLDGRAPEGHVLLRTFVGGELQAHLLQRDDDAIEQLVRGELKTIFGVGGREDFVDVVRYRRAMPQYRVGHLKLVEAIDASLQALPGLGLAGNAFRGVGIPDVIHRGESAAEGVLAAVERRVGG